MKQLSDIFIPRSSPCFHSGFTSVGNGGNEGNDFSKSFFKMLVEVRRVKSRKEHYSHCRYPVYFLGGWLYREIQTKKETFAMLVLSRYIDEVICIGNNVRISVI
jgi:hypothetical protein